MKRVKIFDAVRKLLKRGFTPSEVVDMDAAINAAIGQIDELVLPGLMTTSAKGIKAIHEFEGLHRRLANGKVKAYPDPATRGEPYTIGYGSTGIDPFNGGRINANTEWTREQCEQRFAEHLKEFESAVTLAIGDAPTSQNQFDAMVSFTYNLGPSAFKSSTLAKRHREQNYAAAADQFIRWNKAAGRIMPGLTRRRLAEARLYKEL